MVNQEQEGTPQHMKLEIFCCYAREDQDLLEKLRRQLSVLVREKQVTLWADTNINAGAAWDMEIKRHLDKAQIILLLISADFLSSDYCYSTEMKQALQRHAQGEACVIPVILRPADWKIPPLSLLQALPANAEPVTGNWRTHDEAYLSVVQGVRKSVALWPEKESLWQASLSSLQSKDYENALKDIEKIIELGFTYAQLYKNKGDALFAQKSYAQALEAYENALKLNAQGQDLYEAKDFAPYRPERKREAPGYGTASPTSMDTICFNLGNALFSLQCYTEAAVAYAQAYWLKPGEQIYKQAFEAILKEAPKLPGNEHYPAEVAEAIRECYYRQDNAKYLGLPQQIDPGDIHRQSPLGTQGYKHPFTHGAIYWNEKNGAYPVWRGVYNLYSRHKGPRGMGFPLTQELKAATSPQGTHGIFQRFEGERDYPEDIPAVPVRYGATAYYSKKYGTYLVGGNIGECYERSGGTSGKLGFPTSNAVNVGKVDAFRSGTTGMYKEFEGGRIYRSQRTGAHPVCDAIAGLHCQEEIRQRLGFPLSDEVPAPSSPQGTTGTFQRFEGSPADDHSQGILVYSSKAYGTYPIWGNIRLCYEQLGGTKSFLGFPLSMEEVAARSSQETEGRLQRFEGGLIFWSEKYGGVPVRGTILSVYDGLQDTKGTFGFPMSSEELVPGDPDLVKQAFEGGIISAPALKAKRWEDINDVVDLVHWLYEQILQQQADASGLITYGGNLHRGEKSVRDVVRILGHSAEYEERFVAGKASDEIATTCVKQFLYRDPLEQERETLAQVVAADGHRQLMNRLIESDEYQNCFTEDDVPRLIQGLGVTSMRPGHLECFYRGQNDHLWNRWWYGESWSEENDMGRILTSAPTAVSWGDNRMDCFYRGPENHLCHRWRDEGGWSKEENLGGLLASAPAVASRFPNHLECFYRGQDNHLWHRYWYGSQWSEAGDLGSFVTSAPAAISWGRDRIDCFYRGRKSHLVHRWWNGEHWHEEDLGGVLTSAPAVASTGSDHLDCLYRGQDHNLWHRQWNGANWSGEERVGGWLTSAPAVVSSGTDRIDCFYRGGDHCLWHRYREGADWSEEELIGGHLC